MYIGSAWMSTSFHLELFRNIHGKYRNNDDIIISNEVNVVMGNETREKFI